MPEIHVTLLGRFAVTVGGVPVAEASWKRRHAAAVVKVLALAPGRRLHREQVIDLVWPQDTIAEAVPKLHKAAHFARRAIGVPDAVVLRGDQVVLCPGGSVTVDAVRFEELARRALAAGDAAAAREALALYGGELLPADRYEEWAETRREQLSQRHLDLLRLDGRWEAVAELDPGDERAHLALMRRHAANGDRHAALRQFERLDRALRQELGLAPGPEASALRDRLLAAHDVFPHLDGPLIGRDLEISIAERALLDAAAGGNRTLIISGEAGAGKSSLLAAIAARATERGFLAGQEPRPRSRAHGRMPRSSRRSAAYAGRIPGCSPAWPARTGTSSNGRGTPRRPRGPGRAPTSGSSSPRPNWSSWPRRERACCSPSTTCTTPTTAACACCTTSPGRRAASGCASCSRTAPFTAAHALEATRRSLIDRYGAAELRLGPLADRDAAALVRRFVAEPPAELVRLVTTLGRGVPFLVAELARRAVPAAGAETEYCRRAGLGAGAAGQHVARSRPATREVLQRVAMALVVRHRRVRRAVRAGRGGGLRPPRRRPGRADHRARERGLPVPPLPHQGRAHRRRPSAPAPPGPPRHRPAPGRAGCLARAHRPPFPGGRRGRGRRAAPAAGGRDGIRRRRLPRRAGAGRRDPAARRRSLPDQGASLRADLLTAIGDPMAGPAYREALGGAGPADARRLRARLANSAVMAGDLATAAAALDGLDTDGGAEREHGPARAYARRTGPCWSGRESHAARTGCCRAGRRCAGTVRCPRPGSADAEEAGVPGLADRQVGHGHGDVRDGRDSS